MNTRRQARLALAVCAIALVGTWAYGQAASFTVSFNFATSAARGAALVDYAKAHGLDIYSDAEQTVVDNAKVMPAVNSFMRQQFKADVVTFRRTNAAKVAGAAQAASDDAALNP